jgi:hypothetical protein
LVVSGLLAGLPPDTPGRAKTADAFFRDVTEEKHWHDEEEKAKVARFRQLQGTLEETLTDVKVFLFGRVEKDVSIVGRTESGWAGLKTRLVET